PAALLGIDLSRLLDRARRMRLACGPAVAARENPGLHLGAALGALARAGRAKLTLVPSERVVAFGAWVEQLIAESTGKEGTGLVALLRAARPHAYVALTAYVERTARREKLLAELRTAIRDRFRVAATVGFGPRFLHSTGQLHKGGPPTAVVVQLSADEPADEPVPGAGHRLGVLETAQAVGR